MLYEVITHEAPVRCLDTVAGPAGDEEILDLRLDERRLEPDEHADDVV